MKPLVFEVVGIPGAQGSKRHVGRGIMVESSRKVKPWRQDVVAAAKLAREQSGHETLTGPVYVEIQFLFVRPKSHYGTGKNAARLKPSAPLSPCSRAVGDIEKLIRSTHDAMTTAQVWVDDSQVCHVRAGKFYTEGREYPGALITVRSTA